MTLYLDSLQPLLPDDIRKQLDNGLLPELKTIVETLLRLVVGAEAPAIGALPGWADLQPRVSKIVDDLKRGEHTRSSQKRPRDDDSATSSKRAKTDETAPSPEDDIRVYSLHGVSVSTPIRKKVNIDIHRSSIRLTNPASQKEEYPPIPLSSLQRAFLLPTRGKSKPHWSVVLLSSDVPASVPKGAAAARDKDAPSAPLVFGLDATLTSVLTTSTADSTTTYPKGQPSLPALRTFLSHLPIPAHEPSTAVFRSAAGSQEGDGVAGVEAYRGAKEGTLWFLDDGVLWDGKPCEFFALEHLAPVSQGQGGEQVVEGLRTLTATGRTCSVILRRIGGGSPADGNAKDKDKKDKKRSKASPDKGEADGEDLSGDEEDRAVDVDFGMVDGREQEPIGRWIKARRNRFGCAKQPSPTSDGANAADTLPDLKGKGKAVARDENPRSEDTEDEEDSDFEVTSTDVSDEDSGTESESEGDASNDEGEGSAEGEDDEGDASDDATGDEMDVAEEELDPKHHPLLRPGAMPRMSRAAMEAVVGMVEQDMMGGGRRGQAAAADSDEDEEDELDD
ncbi:hypothetical protein BD309DRAFT_881446 [Dichomitus squalens]|nr:hypothetical protein BD309DRAFT_881446 [Dichomitus squalens]